MRTKKLKTGYHYTSKANWEKIQKDGGMKRYHIDKPELHRYFPKGLNGVWVWPENPTGQSHAGNILYQVSRKASPEIVKLEVQYNPKQLATYHGQEIDVRHVGHVNEWEYHKNERGVIVENDIPLQNIKLVGEYNTVQRLQ